MNNAFKNTNMISLDSSHHITSDGENGVCLTFHEVRKREKVKTGETEEYLYEQKLYYPRICQAIRYYIDKTQNSSNSLEELATKLEYNKELLEKIDQDFKQFN